MAVLFQFLLLGPFYLGFGGDTEIYEALAVACKSTVRKRLQVTGLVRRCKRVRFPHAKSDPVIPHMSSLGVFRRGLRSDVYQEKCCGPTITPGTGFGLNLLGGEP